MTEETRKQIDSDAANIRYRSNQNPRKKMPISAEHIKEAQRLIDQANGKGAAEVLRNIRYKLEDFEARIHTGKKI
jgi:hypothetical protein